MHDVNILAALIEALILWDVTLRDLVFNANNIFL